MRTRSRSARRAACAVLMAAALSCNGDTRYIAEILAVRPDRIGAVRIGMSLTEVRRTLGEDLEADYADFESCDHVAPTSLLGAMLMVVRDTIVRVEVRESSVLTAEGAGVGTTEAHLLELYGDRARVTPHKYSGPVWHYVTVRAEGDSTHAIVFETDGQRVQSYRAGRLPEVEWVEGCA